MVDRTHEQREEAVRERVNRLSEAGRERFYQEAHDRLKDPDTYAATNAVFFGGIHHFYLGRWQRGVLDVALLVGAMAAFFAGRWMLGTGLAVGLLLIELPYLFMAQRIVRQYNLAIQEEVLDRIEKGGRPSRSQGAGARKASRT